MKKSLIAAATFAAITLGAAAMPASAAGVGTGLAGVGAHNQTQLTENVYYRRWHRHGHRRWACFWRHHHRHCYWKYW